ncbi:hypothetical protein ACHQM5_018525 [Ranunculus cassubicifolius]
MESSPNPEKPQTHHHTSNIRTIKDLYISANLYNPQIKPSPSPSPRLSRKDESHRWITNIYNLPGYGYLTGTLIGGTKGSIEGLKAASLGDSFKVRRKLVMDCGIEGGKRFGGALGMVGLIYGVWEFGVVYFVTKNPNPYDVVNTVVAGYGTGWTYKMFSGKKIAHFAGLVGAVVAVSGKAIMKKNAFLCHMQYES